MEVAVILACVVLIDACMRVFRVWLCKRRLLRHPFVTPLSLAFPANAPFIQAMVDELSDIMKIDPPRVYVYRARLSNAFVTAMALRPELYIADEAFESANGHDHPLACLAALIAHELAHLKLNHAPKHAVWRYLSSIRALSKAATRMLANLEQEADRLGAQVCGQYLIAIEART